MMGKLKKLYKLLSEMECVVVSFSGGIDSTFLLKAAFNSLGNNIIAVTAVSPSMPDSDKNSAIQFAKQLGIKHKILNTQECDDPDYIKNDPNRCYYCKLHIGNQMLEFAKNNGYKYVIEGSNADDLNDYRPGMKAKNELGLRSPLQEIGFTKTEIRELSQQLGLPNWNKPSSPCLSSRVPYGTPINLEILKKIGLAEDAIKSYNIENVRVRYHGQTARIEVDEKEFPVIMQNKKEIVNKLKKIGYLYIALDLAGFRSGSLNEGIDNG